MTKDNCNWEAVRRAFPLEVINLDEKLVLRPLAASDLTALCDIMTGDPEMTWPRKAWDRGHVEYLLGLRLNHYSTYGFGPYAVILAGRLVGMAGVQVWDDKPCSVELLAYVAKDIWSLGIGTRLLRWIIDIARQSGFIHEIFAATRAENERAISLARRVGFTEIGHGTHYGYPSIKWVLAL